MDNKEKETPNVVQIPLEWDWNSDLDTIYVNHLRVTHAGPEFYIYFGELPFPGNLSEEGFPDKLTINTKVRLVVSKEQMGKFVKALSENYENYLLKKEKKHDLEPAE